jgi:cyclopropane-fatty-acyl-phospholipid synthase
LPAVNLSPGTHCPCPSDSLVSPDAPAQLARWRTNFQASLGQVRALGFPETFVRLWEFYLCYCEAGFAEGQLGDAQILFERSG